MAANSKILIIIGAVLVVFGFVVPFHSTRSLLLELQPPQELREPSQRNIQLSLSHTIDFGTVLCVCELLVYYIITFGLFSASNRKKRACLFMESG